MLSADNLPCISNKAFWVDCCFFNALSLAVTAADMQDANYNLLDSELKSNLEGIKSNLESYTIEDLYKGISEKCTALI